MANRFRQSSLPAATHTIRQWQSLGGVAPYPLDWKGFEAYLLQHCNKKTTGDRLRYARRYGSVILGNNVDNNNRISDILQLSGEKRLHVMKTLSSLAKYTGQYDKWLQLRQRYNLKWANENANLQSFERFFNPDLTLENMLQRIKEMIDKTPVQMGNIIKFATLTGLRAKEAIESIKLLGFVNVDKPYYNSERQCLEHFRYPAIFLRRTKTAYISIVDNEILETVVAKATTRTSAVPSYSAIHMHLRRQHLPMCMAYCRKVFASHLRQSGIESEIVDLLQGRVPRSVFARHYFRPSSDYKQRVLEAVHKLRRQIE